VDFAETVSIAAADDATAAPAADAPARSLAHGLTVFGVYFAFYLATLAGALAPFPPAVCAALALANGVFIAMVFIVGHDCAHGSLVPGRGLNRWLARLCFLPVLHSASLWRLAHNHNHHGRTNLKGHDPVWVPMGLREYRAASPARQMLERVYRGVFGPVLYYHTAIWIPMLLLPLNAQARAQWKRHVVDSVIVFAGGAALVAAILFAGHALAPERSLWTIALLGWALPFATWSYLAAATTYLNHTHPAVPWFDDEATWRAQNGHVVGTVHVKMPVDFLPLYSDVMAHTAHHANVATPVYALPHEQARLKAKFGARVTDYVLSVDAYRRIVKACKLYDFDRKCWTDFDGEPTGPMLADD
jgi:omega-6 fatty acid desaturase (delta-12 desaturase)